MDSLFPPSRFLDLFHYRPYQFSLLYYFSVLCLSHIVFLKNLIHYMYLLQAVTLTTTKVILAAAHYFVR